MSEAAKPSLGLQALMLIRLDARAGELVSVDTLASTYRVTAQAVRAALLALHVAGYAKVELGADDVINAAKVPAAH